MRGTSRWLGAGLAIAVAVGSCRHREDEPARRAATPAARPTAAAPSAERVQRDMLAAQERIVERADSVRDAMVQVRGLSRAERGDLKRDVNRIHLATAQRFGTRARNEKQVEELVRRGRMVELEDSTQYWVLRDLQHSIAYVTPDTRAMLLEIGRRFHARLDTLGLPRYRMEVTSVLRTPESQARLRSSNGNAARGVSSHEYGTTLDVAHVRFAPPAGSQLTVTIPSAPDETAQMRFVEGYVLEEVARKHALALQGELGRVLREMRREGKLRVIMERQQAVYHMTVARDFPNQAE